MTIYKACPQIDYNGMEGYYTKLKDAVEAVNKFLREEYYKWGVNYDFECLKETGDDIYFIHKVYTYATRSNEKSILGIKKVTLNE